MSRRKLVLSLWGVVVFGLAVKSFAGATVGDARGEPIEVVPVVIDINRASVAELQVLPGIGAVRAESIVLDRVRNGPFREVGDLDRVDGVGSTILGGLGPFSEAGTRGRQR